MGNLLQQTLNLIDQGTVEQRCAAMIVLAALKLDNASVTKSVGAVLDHANPVLKDYALRYFEEVQSANGTTLVLKFLEDPDKGVQERVVRCLTRIGQGVVQPLAQRLPDASRLWQLNAARILCATRGKAALKALLQILRAGTDEFNRAVCDLMTPMIREMDAKERDTLCDELEAFAPSLDVKQQRPAVISTIRLFGQLGRPQARRWLCKFLGAEQHPSLRAHALVALLCCLREQELRKDEYAKLFPLLEEAEFSEVTRLALELLDAHELPADSRPLLSRLLESPHADVQKFALRKMGDVGSPASVRTLVEQLGDSDYRRRDVAARALRKIPEARSALIKEFLACDDASKAWSIAELLPSFDGKWRQDVLESLWKRLQAAVGAEDRIQNAFLSVLKQADGNYAYEQLAAQGTRLIKAKKYKEAVDFLTPLKEFSELKPEHRFHLALAQLKLHSPTVASHRQHPAVELLSDLCRLFSLGFSLVERSGEERSLGRDLLEHLASRFPRNKVGKSAKNKLKLVTA